MVLRPESRSKISNHVITELFYSHIHNMRNCFLHKKSFRRLHISGFRYSGFALRNVSGAFEKRALARGTDCGYSSLTSKKPVE